MIDLNDLRARPDAYRQACVDKRSSFDIDAFLTLDGKRREFLAQFEELRAQQNRLGKEVPKLKGPEKEQKLAELKDLSGKIKEGEEAQRAIDTEWHRQQMLVPSIPLASVPKGKDDTENVVIKTWGDVPKFSFKPKDHVELGEALDIIDIERGVKIAGARNYVLKGAGARLHHALLNFAMDFIQKRGYTLFDPPHIVLYQSMAGTGYFPGGEEMAYHLDERDSEYYLIGTSEVPCVAYHKDETFELSQLPVRYTGYSPCYRREAGTYGKDTHGLYRVHQFYKVEQVIFSEADDALSAKLHAELLKNSEDLLQALGIPYQVTAVCTGDMGQGQVYKNDINSWMPSRNAYCETHSCSTLHSFQARRLGIRYKDKDGKKQYCHTLNNTLAASPRILIPLLELNQNADGSIRVPEALRPFMGGQEVIKGR